MKKSIILNPDEIQNYIKDLRKIPVMSHERQDEIFELLKNSKNCKVSFCSMDMGWGYKAFWLEKWAFKTTYFKDYTKISITILFFHF